MGYLMFIAFANRHSIEGLTPFEVLRDMDKKGELVAGGYFTAGGK